MTTTRAKNAEGEAPLLERGARVDHFKIMRSLGSGGIGEVYLARDMRLGRKVALKMLRPQHVGSRRAARRFLEEARATARFNHPHIVAIHSVGEHLGSPYLALEYIRGQTLRTRMSDGTLGSREVLRIALAIADALSHAHAAGILHRDLKPDNVIIAQNGRPRVVDFGLAKQVDLEAQVAPLADNGVPGQADEANEDEIVTIDGALEIGTDTPETHISRGLVGTPRYMAPEQWRSSPSPASDVWALGIIIWETISGRHPYQPKHPGELVKRVTSSAAVPGLHQASAELAALVARCLEKDPRRRATASAVAEELRRLLYGGKSQPDEVCPFRGLMPYAEEHTELFCAREAEIAGFVERARQNPVLAVVGPPGTGKTSFVQAGVIPRLREQGPWLVLRMRPGTQPLKTLAARLDGAADPLGATPRALGVALQRRAEQEQARVLLFVDQLEEVFTLVTDRGERQRFIEALCMAADDPQDPVRVIFTLRDDLLSRLTRGGALRESLGQLTVLRTPEPPALEQAIRKPLERVGYGLDDETLASEIATEAGNRRAGLSLVQLTATALWESRDREHKVVTRAAYEAAGGVAGILATCAEAVVDELTQEQLQLAKSVFLRLAFAQGTQRCVRLSSLHEALGSRVVPMVDGLTAARLLAVGRDDAGDRVVELAHRSLVTAWPRLTRWLDQSHEELAFLSELNQAAELWQKRGRRDDEVWNKAALQDARDKLRRVATPLSERARDFLAASELRQQWLARIGRGVLAAAIGLLGLLGILAVLLALVIADKDAETAVHQERARLYEAKALVEGAHAALLQQNLVVARAKLRASLEVRDTTAARALWARLRVPPLGWQEVASTQSPVTPGNAKDPSPEEHASGAGMAGETQPMVRLEAIPSSQVVALTAGHANSLVAGYAQKVVGLWCRKSGRLLESATLDAPVVKLYRMGKTLRAQSATGQQIALDLSIYEAERCELLRSVWRQVSVVWEHGLAQDRRLPAHHACATAPQDTSEPL